MKTSPSSFVLGIKELPSPPEVFYRINEVIESPGANVRDVAKVVSEDSALTAKILRLVNSAFYGFPQQIDTISRAVLILGMEQLKQLALCVTVMRSFNAIPSELVDMRLFWKHSLACGLIARNLSALRREVVGERFFVIGMLHDIGRLIIALREPELIGALLKRAHSTGELLHDLEKQILGFHHGDIGAQLIELWNLPASISEAVASQYVPTRTRTYLVESSTIHIADIIATSMPWSLGLDRHVATFNPTAWETLGLEVDLLPSLIQTSKAQLREVEKAFRD